MSHRIGERPWRSSGQPTPFITFCQVIEKHLEDEIYPPVKNHWSRPLFFAVLKSASGAVESVPPNKSVYLSAKLDLLEVALEPD